MREMKFSQKTLLEACAIDPETLDETFPANKEVLCFVCHHDIASVSSPSLFSIEYSCSTLVHRHTDLIQHELTQSHPDYFRMGGRCDSVVSVLLEEKLRPGPREAVHLHGLIRRTDESYIEQMVCPASPMLRFDHTQVFDNGCTGSDCPYYYHDHWHVDCGITDHPAVFRLEEGSPEADGKLEDISEGICVICFYDPACSCSKTVVEHIMKFLAEEELHVYSSKSGLPTSIKFRLVSLSLSLCINCTVQFPTDPSSQTRSNDSGTASTIDRLEENLSEYKTKLRRRNIDWGKFSPLFKTPAPASAVDGGDTSELVSKCFCIYFEGLLMCECR